MDRKKWNIISYNKERALLLAEETGYDSFAVLLALSRGIDTPEKLHNFFGAKTAELSSPFLIKDMDKGVERIRRAIEDGEKILVYGDYDCDGVTSTALLYTYLQNTGADVDFYIPSRIGDGYGLSGKTAEKILQGGFDLVITVDNGIAAIEEAEFFKKNGIDMVVTDHHQAGEVLPDCAAVIDPHRPDDTSPFKELAGVGVALKLAAALEDGDYSAVLSDYLDIAALGTIADIVPLTGENRTIVSMGIAALKNTSRPGLLSLFEGVNIYDKSFSANSIAFYVTPKLNAAGRMDSAETALELLITEDFNRANELVELLLSANSERQRTEGLILDEIEKQFESDKSYEDDAVLVVAGRGWHPGVIGIVSSRLVDKYGKPAFVISVSENGEAKGSCRSIPGFSLYDALKECESLLIKFGGHTLAAGFSVKEELIPEFRKAINSVAEKAGELSPVLNIDCRINPLNLSISVLDSLSLLEPFGAENPLPVFGLFSMTVTAIRPTTTNKSIIISFSKKNVKLSAVYYSHTAENFPFLPGEKVDVAVLLEKNEYMGKTSLNIKVQDIRPAGTDDEKLFCSLNSFSRFSRGKKISFEDKAKLLPSRALFEKIYTYIKNNEGCSLSPELFAYKTGEPPEKAGSVCAVLAAFEELNIIINENGSYKISPVKTKQRLEDSEIIKKLI